jgi:hypothetical protein
VSSIHTAAGLDVAVETVEVVDPTYSAGSSSSLSVRSAQHTPEDRRLFMPTGLKTNVAFEATSGVLTYWLLGELVVELTGDEGKDTKLLHLKIPAASSSAAFSCTQSGSIRDRKGVEF